MSPLLHYTRPNGQGRLVTSARSTWPNYSASTIGCYQPPRCYDTDYESLHESANALSDTQDCSENSSLYRLCTEGTKYIAPPHHDPDEPNILALLSSLLILST
jgi:hypothetical protein